jgi:hypothetical protein
MGRVFRDLLRYGLLAMMLQTAWAAQRRYRVVTAWLPNLVSIATALLLPDALRALFPPRHTPRNLVEDTLITMVRDNPNYLVYVVPFALGAIAAHPRINIYKSDVQVAGFGLDAIPHSATGFALTVLIADTFETMGGREAYHGLLAELLCWGKSNPALLTLGALALVTLIWEYGEYQILQYETTHANGDLQMVNMEWSVENTVQDVISNFVGWAAAMVWRGGRSPSQTSHS